MPFNPWRKTEALLTDSPRRESPEATSLATWLVIHDFS